MNYSYSYAYGDGMGGIIATILFYALYAVFGGGLGVALYIFRSLGVYTIAKRRALRNSWFAWVPVVNQYLLGSLSDQYQYVTKGKIKSKRKWLLGLNIVTAVLYVASMGLAIGIAIKLMGNAMAGFNGVKLARVAMQSLSAMLFVVIPMAVVALAALVIRYVALYDVYASLEPKNAVMYTVLSIVFRITEPFFLFFNRNKEEGMPPRRDTQPVHDADEYEEVPLENE